MSTTRRVRDATPARAAYALRQLRQVDRKARRGLWPPTPESPEPAK